MRRYLFLGAANETLGLSLHPIAQEVLTRKKSVSTRSTPKNRRRTCRMKIKSQAIVLN